MNFGSLAAFMPQLAPGLVICEEPNGRRSNPEVSIKSAGLLRGACHRAGHFGPDPLARNDGFYRHTPCARALLSAAEAISQSGIPIAILVQPTPQGVPALSHQIRHQPSSKRTSA
jgi:hypothetical protein